MERQRKQTPGRFLRRNKPYFLLVLALVLLIAAVIFCVKIVRELYTPAQPSVPASAHIASSDARSLSVRSCAVSKT